jgi:hypothetical protein
MLDAAFAGAGERFLGSIADLRPVSAMTFAHELGHLVSFTTGAAEKFNKFVKDEGIKPFTPYAAADAQGGTQQEFFAEAFFLFATDPEWLKSSHPKVFAWFETFNAQLGRSLPRKKP